MVTIKIEKLKTEVKIPVYANPEDAGLDVFSQEYIILKPGKPHVFNLGFKAEIPEGHVALVWDKGGFGKAGIKTLAGVIDASYRGEWVVILQNLSRKNFKVRKGDKIAQILIQKVEKVKIINTDKLTKSLRGEGKFGSSGRK